MSKHDRDEVKFETVDVTVTTPGVPEHVVPAVPETTTIVPMVACPECDFKGKWTDTVRDHYGQAHTVSGSFDVIVDGAVVTYYRFDNEKAFQYWAHSFTARGEGWRADDWYRIDYDVGDSSWNDVCSLSGDIREAVFEVLSIRRQLRTLRRAQREELKKLQKQE